MAMDNNKLYTLAMRCAEQNARGCSHQCQVCQLNVFNYTEDTKDAALVKATAFSDFQLRNRLKQEQRTHDTYRRVALSTPLLVCGLIVAAIVQMCTSAASSKPSQVLRAPATAEEVVTQTSILQMFMNAAEAERTQLSVRDETIWLKAHQNDVHNVPRVLRLMRRAPMWDYDGDGVVDCVDYSKVFALLYGQDAVLVYNQNQSAGMNHMFVRVFYGDKFMDVEPQRQFDDYAMHVAWGSRYDTRYNKYW